MDTSRGRERRATKTPKRFDDEAYETPLKQTQQAKPSPEPKSIIKVKLAPKLKVRKTREPNKSKEPPPKIALPSRPSLAPPSKPTVPIKLKEAPKTRAILKFKDTFKPKDSPNNNKDSPNSVEAGPKPKETPKLSVTPKPKEVPKSKEANKSKELIKPKETSKPRETSKVKEQAKLKEHPKSEVRTLDRESPLVHRPKTKRPRTPPVYADLIPNVVLPFWDARTAAEDHEDDNVKELVHCHCGIAEELGLMVQCETCLTWQHAHCLGIDSPEEAPDGYTCRACSDPKFARESMKWAYDQDWLTKGKMKQFPCDTNPPPEKRMANLNKINKLINSVLNIHKLIHSLRVKQKILADASDDDAELKHFRQQCPVNYQHHDGNYFIPTINHPSSTPASTISAIAETPEAGDMAVESAVADASLPDIGQLEDVSAILESSPYANNVDNQQVNACSGQNMSNSEATPNDCRSNLKLNINQTEEFIGIELAYIEEQLTALEKESESLKESKIEISLDSLKNDLLTMKKYISINNKHDN